MFLEEGPLPLFDALLDVDISTFSTGRLLLGGNERGGGMRTRADICLCKDGLQRPCQVKIFEGKKTRS